MFINLNNILIHVKDIIHTDTAKQTISLYFSEIVVILLSVVIGIINTRSLGPEGFGIFALFITITSFTVIFFRFGIFSSASALLAYIKDEQKEKEMVGAIILLTFLIGIIYAIFLFILSFFVDSIFNSNIGWMLRWFSILSIALPYTLVISLIGRGTNQIHAISMYNIIRPLFYIVGALVVLSVVTISQSDFILLYLISVNVAVIISLYYFRPKFTHLKENVSAIFKKTKEYGLDLYIGQIADQGTTQLISLLIPIFVNSTELGFFTLATYITGPMSTFSRSLSVTRFKHFAHSEGISRKIIFYNAIWLTFCVFILFLFGSLIINTFFGNQFSPAITLLLPLSIAGFFAGMYQPYNLFLSVKMKGKWLRNMSFIMSVVSILGCILVIPKYGTVGAAMVTICANGTFFLTCLFYYYKYLKEVSNGS